MKGSFNLILKPEHCTRPYCPWLYLGFDKSWFWSFDRTEIDLIHIENITVNDLLCCQEDNLKA